MRTTRSASTPLQIVKRSGLAKGFVVLPRRWIVERTLGWPRALPALARNYENGTCALRDWNS